MRAGSLLLRFVLLVVVVTPAACTHGKGPHLQLVTPSASTPNFGDAPSRASESMQQGPGGGGGAGVAEPPSGNTGSRGSVVGPIVGGALGVGASAAAVGAGLVTCKPGEDTPSSDAGSTNLCTRPR